MTAQWLLSEMLANCQAVVAAMPKISCRANARQEILGIRQQQLDN